MNKIAWMALLFCLLLQVGGCTETLPPVASSVIAVEPEADNYLSTTHDEVTAILLEEADVSFGVCDEDVGDLKTGDPCIVVSGRITSHDTESWVIALRAVGYDQNGLKMAHTQESFMIPGRAGVEARYGETAAFVIHLNTSDEVETIRLYAQSHSYEEFQPRPPSTPLPQEELTRIVFSREWLIENDVEPDEGTVTITFPESWLREPPEIPEGEEIVELAVPTRLLMDHNTSDDPSQITVTFPDHYFDGL